MTLEYDLFWSFRSPYSYLVTPRLIEFEREYDVKANVRPVYPIAIRIPGFFKQVNPMWPPYLFRDCSRIAEMLGMPFAWPSPDPIVMTMSTGEVATEQPYIHRLTRLGIAAVAAGMGLPFLAAVSAIIFGGVRDWHLGDHLAGAAQRAGLDLAKLDSEIERDPNHYEAAIAENESAQKRAGHWGVPLMVFNAEPFFGQDRFDLMRWRMQRTGLTRRR
jgi:2-hydroxychromene-2-carboxylate isomerase